MPYTCRIILSKKYRIKAKMSAHKKTHKKVDIHKTNMQTNTPTGNEL